MQLANKTLYRKVSSRHGSTSQAICISRVDALTIKSFVCAKYCDDFIKSFSNFIISHSFYILSFIGQNKLEKGGKNAF